MLRLAGFSSGRGLGARGGLAAGRCDSIEMSCVRSRLLRISVGMSCVRLTPAPRFCWNVLRSLHACCLPHKRQTGRLAGGCVSIPRGSGSPLVRSRMPCGYRALLVHFGLARFFMAIPTEDEGTRGTESAARQSAFLHKPIGLAMFSAGSTLGLRAPDCAKESSTLWTLFI